MKEILDPGGYKIALHRAGKDIICTGTGPRNGDCGAVCFDSNDAERAADYLAELAETQSKTEVFVLPAKPSRSPLIMSGALVTRDGFVRNCHLLYLMGPAGGYRRPVEVHDQSTFRYMAEIIRSFSKQQNA